MKLVNWFKTKYPDLVKKMKECDHEIAGFHSPYHSEGDVWTHTMMVYNLADDFTLKVIALLHDIGKPFTQCIKQENKYYSFTGHEFYSCFLAVDILKEIEKEFQPINKELILQVINYHQDLFKLGKLINDEIQFKQSELSFINNKFHNLELYDYLVRMTDIDGRGRICEDSTRLQKQIEFYKNYLPTEPFIEEGRPELIILAGLQGTGKSTLAKSLIKDHIYLSLDDIMMEGNRQNLPYGMFFSEKRRDDAIKEFYKRLEMAISKRKPIIIDNVNLDEKARNRQLKMIPDRYYFKRAINVIASIDTIERINKERKKEMRDVPQHLLDYGFRNFAFIGEGVHKSEVVIS